MPTFKCYPISDPNSLWNYCPSFGAAILFSVLFGIPTVAHSIQALLLRKPFACVLVMGGIWETLGYIFRILSVMHQLSSGLYTAQQLLILLAPLWINAFVYMVLGRMVHFFLEHDQIFGIKARRITLMFVLFDISAFIVQAAGGLMTSDQSSPSTQRLGLHVYMGGVGLQLVFILIFIALAARFQFLVHRQESGDDVNVRVSVSLFFGSFSSSTRGQQAQHLLHIVYAVLGLIIFRNIYRLVEYACGVYSNITMHEWYSYVFDAVPMLAALVLFNIWHPGRILQGARSDFSEDNKVRRELKKEKKAAQKMEKEDKKRAKAEKKREQLLAKAFVKSPEQDAPVSDIV